MPLEHVNENPDRDINYKKKPAFFHYSITKAISLTHLRGATSFDFDVAIIFRFARLAFFLVLMWRDDNFFLKFFASFPRHLKKLRLT